MNIKLKICGMREPDNIREVGALQPDFMGFIFYPDSPRCVPGDFKIPVDLPASIKRTGVFVNEKLEQILDTVNKHALDFVQLHADEPVELCKELQQTGIGVIKVFSIEGGFDFGTINPYKKVVDFFLFDTKGKQYGGNASAFDWDLLKQYDQEVPFFLGGGISLANMNRVSQLKDMNLYAVDVNSGVEVSPGMKDVGKVDQLLEILNSLFL